MLLNVSFVYSDVIDNVAGLIYTREEGGGSENVRYHPKPPTMGIEVDVFNDLSEVCAHRVRKLSPRIL